MYGKGDATLAEDLTASSGSIVTVDMVARIRAAILGNFRKFNDWCRAREFEARKTGKVWTEWEGEQARWRPLWRIASQDDYERSIAEHGAYNSPIQGTAADFCTASIGAVIDWILEDAVPAKLVLAVHDSLLFEVRKDAVDEVIFNGKRIMTSWDSRGVPIVVDAKRGEAWGSLKKAA